MGDRRRVLMGDIGKDLGKDLRHYLSPHRPGYV